MREEILRSIDEGMRAIEGMKNIEGLAFIERSATMIADCFQRGNKLLLCGNGGSLCDATHFAEELTGFYRQKRPALPAIALAEAGHLTCVGNDIGFSQVFSRGVEAYGKIGDLLILLTTSGNSDNLVTALQRAKEQGLQTIAFLGKTGGKLKGQADSGFNWSDRIQEAHMMAIHIIIEQVEKLLFSPCAFISSH
jgi:D-sedoheptulose 7-phosphate isomerase